jgi:predicted glycosyltransferase
MPLRVFIWVQSRLGIGHLARALKLAEACSAYGMIVAVAHGGMPVAALQTPPGIRLIQLPPAQAPDLDSKKIADEYGREIDDAWRAQRVQALHVAIADVAPDVVVTETYPLGRRIFGFEWAAFLESLPGRTVRPLMVASVRDVLIPPSKESKLRAMIALTNACYDLILCHGERAILPLESSFPAIADLTVPISYVGYLGARRPSQAPRRGVVIAAGGGAVGQPLFDAAMQAKRLWWRETGLWTVIGGPQLEPGALAALRAQAGPEMSIHAGYPGLAQLYDTAQLVVAQAGYNTVVEALGAGAQLTVVPYATPKETEQSMRARRFAEAGWLTLVEPAELTPAALVLAMEAALNLPPAPAPFPQDGAARAAAAIVEAWERRR